MNLEDLGEAGSELFCGGGGGACEQSTQAENIFLHKWLNKKRALTWSDISKSYQKENIISSTAIYQQHNATQATFLSIFLYLSICLPVCLPTCIFPLLSSEASLPSAPLQTQGLRGMPGTAVRLISRRCTTKLLFHHAAKRMHEQRSARNKHQPRNTHGCYIMYRCSGRLEKFHQHGHKTISTVLNNCQPAARWKQIPSVDVWKIYRHGNTAASPSLSLLFTLLAETREAFLFYQKTRVSGGLSLSRSHPFRR